MSDPAPTTLPGAAAHIGDRLVASLPAQYLMLLLLNLAFIGGLFWFLDRRDTARERLITPIIAACLEEERAHAR